MLRPSIAAAAVHNKVGCLLLIGLILCLLSFIWGTAKVRYINVLGVLTRLYSWDSKKILYLESYVSRPSIIPRTSIGGKEEPFDQQQVLVDGLQLFTVCWHWLCWARELRDSGWCNTVYLLYLCFFVAYMMPVLNVCLGWRGGACATCTGQKIHSTPQHIKWLVQGGTSMYIYLLFFYG